MLCRDEQLQREHTRTCHVERMRDISVLCVTEFHLTIKLLSFIYLTVILFLLFDAKSNKNFGTRAQQSLVPLAR